MDTDVKKYLEAKRLLAELEAKVAKYRGRILEDMKAKGVSRIATAEYKIAIRRVEAEHIRRADVPAELWARYSRPSISEQLVVTESKKRPENKKQ
jgi:hypothetical protein